MHSWWCGFRMHDSSIQNRVLKEWLLLHHYLVATSLVVTHTSLRFPHELKIEGRTVFFSWLVPTNVSSGRAGTSCCSPLLARFFWLVGGLKPMCSSLTCSCWLPCSTPAAVTSCKVGQCALSGLLLMEQHSERTTIKTRKTRWKEG